jgi:WD40 repeat protein
VLFLLSFYVSFVTYFLYSCAGHRRHLLFGGRKGHVATFDCMKTTVGCELQLQEEVHDVQYLHNETMFAVAQNKYTYVYDNKGVEIHCMKRHERPFKLDYLPYHFLLTTVGHSGWVKWHDVSTGEFVAGYGTGHGPCRVLTHNPTNAVSHLGHSNGVVTLWSPAGGKALVSMFCHKSPVTSIAVDREGRYMATAGLDGYLKVKELKKAHAVGFFLSLCPVLILALLLSLQHYICLFEFMSLTILVFVHDVFTRYGTCANTPPCRRTSWTSPRCRWTSPTAGSSASAWGARCRCCATPSRRHGTSPT